MLSGLVFFVLRAPGAFTAGIKSESGLSSDAISLRIKTELSQDNNVDHARVDTDIAQLLEIDPLSDDALVFHTQSITAQGKWVEFDPVVFNVVKRRNPRNRQNLGALLDYSLSRGNLATAVKTIDILFRLDQDTNKDELLDRLTRLYSIEPGRVVIDEYLEKTPIWGLSFLDIITKTASNETIDQVNNSLQTYMTDMTDLDALLPQISLVIETLLEAGKISQAHDLWTRATPSVEAEASTETPLNYNPQLSKRLSPAPFNWMFPAPQVSDYEQSNTQIFMSFLGAKKTELATQYFIPKPGPFSIVIAADYDYVKEQGGFSVETACLSTADARAKNEPRYTVQLDDEFGDSRRHEHEFEGFDDACNLASLTVLAEPGVYQKRIAARFRYIAVVPRDVTSQTRVSP